MNKIEHIQADGKRFYPQESGVQDIDKVKGCFYPVCFIKKLWFGRWQIDYHEDFMYGYSQDNQIPNARLILFPGGIEQIKFRL